MTLVAPAAGELFFPELIAGPDALSSEQRTTLETYFAAVAARRQFPVHSAVLWNALVWGFDLTSGSYPQAPIDDLAIVAHQTRTNALPVGAFVKVPFGGTDAAGKNEFWGEVVYKEGRAPGLEGAWIPAELSGAPAAVTVDETGRRCAVVREALVIDFDAILEADPSALQRQCERGRCIDMRRHVVVDAVYEAALAADGTEEHGAGEHNDADLDDATFFAHWMVAHHADLLRQGRFGAGLGSDALADDALFLEALVSSLASIEEIATDVLGCRSWRGYLFDAAAYERKIADTENALGGADMVHLARGLASVPRGSTVAYVGLSTRVVDEFGDDAGLHGPDWATVVCHQSRFTIDWLGTVAPDGVLRTTPYGPVHLRLDDAWQAGGVWRAQVLPDGPDPICALPPDLALGLGYAEATGLILEWPETIEETAGLETEPEAFETASTELGARVVLSATDIDTRRLRLPPVFIGAVLDTLAEHGHSSLLVRLAAEDNPLEPSERTHWVSPQDTTDVPTLAGVDWVWPFVVGLRAEAVWTQGTTVIDVTARLRLEPLVLGDVVFGWDCDEVIYARAAGLAPPLVTTRARTLRDLLLGVFRTKARPDAAGVRRATLSQLSFAVYGPGASSAARRAVEVVVSTLSSEKVLVIEPADDGGECLYVWAPTLRPATRVADRDTLTAYQGHMARYVREHEVGLHLRRLTVSEVATFEREYQYRAEWESAGRPFWLPPELPHGFTYVRKHLRGH